MSWPLAAFAILAGALAGGFAWYERSRPDARIVALVGTLAAFAALGRIAFAALPNVKPTTDIVLVAGFALGGAPGFVVGAVAGLTSNFFFGQGPWTPWQMAAWGVVGLIGAGVAVLSRRRIGRTALAVVCGVVGFGFTAAQDVGDWVNYSDHSVAQLGVYVGKGLGFDGLHAAGCVVFALAFGPALMRSIARFATRLQVTWRDPQPAPADARADRALDRALVPSALIACVLAGAAALGAGAPARAASRPGTTGAAAYLLSAQNADGGFGAASGQASAQLYAGWAALGLAAAGHNPLDVRRGGGASAAAYIESAAPEDVGALERTILVARAGGLNPADFGGRNLLAQLRREIRPNGSVAGQVNLTAFAVLAQRAAGEAPSPATLAWLVGQQDADGGFNFVGRGGDSDVDDTGAALQALAGPGRRARAARERAVRFICAQQNRDGGFPSNPGGDSNAQSTAWAIQGLLAAGVRPGSVTRRTSRSPLAYLSSQTAADGHIRYSRQSDQTPVWVTAQSVMALAGKPLPLAPVAREAPPGSDSAPPPPRVPASRPAASRPPGPRPAASRLPSPRPTSRRRSSAPRVAAATAGLARASALVLVWIAAQ